jgi:PII-like signaling protein
VTEALKLTTYFGERDRAAGGWLADAFTGIHARHELRASVLLRGAEGFGAKQALHTDRLLSLSEDLPLVSVAVDAPARIEAVLEEIRRLRFDGLVTLERARFDPVPGLDGEVKLTAYLGRGERHRELVALLHLRGVAGATVLLGVDGTAHGARQRAGFFSRNARVPVMVIAVGDGARIAAALEDVRALLVRPLLTLERVRVCKRDGVRLADPHDVAGADPSGLGVWQKLMVYTGEQAGVSAPLIRALRSAGAAGATSLRGVWGYHGDHAPHGDSLGQLRRRVPVVTVIVDSPERIRRWFELVDRHTARTGLVTSELVPAFRATLPGGERGGLRLAQP